MKPPLLCYLCGKPATTKDHVPPKTLFAPPRPHNLITLPCCAECNGAYALDEEYFRNNIFDDFRPPECKGNPGSYPQKL